MNRKGDPERDDRPVGGVVEARPPNRAAVDLTAIEMRERPDLGRAEDLHLGLVLSPILIHAEAFYLKVPRTPEVKS
jgi:hypothetical protein